MIQIVTGKRGYPHVTSYQMQAFNRGVIGDFALIGNNNKMQAQKINNNLVRILDGCVVFQGIYAIIEQGNYEDVAIENVEVGYRRIDTIYLHYTKNASTVLESVSIDVEKGQTVQSNPVPPTFPDADRWEDDIDVKIPMYDVLVTMDGITITPYERMTKEYPSLNEVFQSVSNGKGLIADAITDKGVITSATDTFATMADNIRRIPSGGVTWELIDFNYNEVEFVIIM